MPATEALLPRFRAANTQVLGVSVDSVFCHANWAVSIGGVSFPLLPDFHPKGAMAASYGLYLEEAGITDRATVIIDSTGVVRHASTVGPSGQRNIEDLAALCESIDAETGGPKEAPQEPRLPEGDATLYVKSRCGFSLKAMNARINLHLTGAVTLKNVSEDAAVMAELKQVGGKDQAPCLVIDGKPLYEADEIVRRMLNATGHAGTA